MTLSGYNPLAAIHIHATTINKPRGLIVVVGPNCSGKTQFLRDIEKTVTGQADPRVVITSVAPQLPANGQHFVGNLLSEQYVRRTTGGDPTVEFYAPYRGKGAGTGGSVSINTLVSHCQQFYQAAVDRNAISAQFFSYCGRVLLTSLFPENRLKAFIETPAFDTEKALPANDLQTLYDNPEAKDELARETGKVFMNAAWLDNTRGDNYWRIKVSGKPELPPLRDRTEAAKMRAYFTIDREGDGYKSYVAIAIALLLGRRPVCIIDEPELHLHPPQAYNLGQLIGRHGRSKEQVTFVSTHSSHVLRGILSTGKEDITVIRLNHIGTEFSAHVLDNAELKSATENPRSRTETILDGVFGQAVAIVEAEGDRVVYQAAMEGIDSPIQELHFVPVHGTGGIDRILKFYRRMKIPAVVIPDFDIIGKDGELTAIIEELAVGEERKQLVELAKETMKEVLRIPPSVSLAEVKEELKGVADSITSWDNQDDTRARRELEAIRKKLYRLRRLKDEGVEGYREIAGVYDNLKNLVERAKQIGLFLVPVGDLENWVPGLMGNVGKSDKSRWADIASERIRLSPTMSGDVWEFMKEVVSYLDEQRRR
jgi:ABC-type cobalamin/Fe3+-siderophores transport system ATPase subunit